MRRWLRLRLSLRRGLGLRHRLGLGLRWVCTCLRVVVRVEHGVEERAAVLEQVREIVTADRARSEAFYDVFGKLR